MSGDWRVDTSTWGDGAADRVQADADARPRMCTARIVVQAADRTDAVETHGIVAACHEHAGHSGPHRSRLRAVVLDVPDGSPRMPTQWFPLTWWGFDRD